MPVNADDMCGLEQAKQRDRKIYITDIAINKVPYVKYYGFTEKQNRIMQMLANQLFRLEMYLASLTFLAKCSEAGLFYR